MSPPISPPAPSPRRLPSARSLFAALAALITLAALALLAPPAVLAQPEDPDAAADAAPVSGDDLTVSVITFGPGQHPFERFGHDAIRIQNAATKKDRVYNFGTFSFSSPALIPEFLRGRLRYWLSRRGTETSFRAYRRQNRSIVAQELDLAPAQRLALLRRLEENLRPENRYYKYDYYRDNCATRVRDAIDGVIGGRLRAASRDPASMTFRRHTLRLVADDLPVYLGLHAAMGAPIDAPITLWEEMFLPVKVQEVLRRATVAWPAGEAPLVKSERVLFASTRPAPRDAPPSWTLRFALAGLAAGGVLAALGAAARTRRAPRVALGALLAVLGLVLGLVGCILAGLWAFTDHAVTYRNENVLLLAPWVLALAGYGAGLALGRPRATRVAAWLTAAAAAAAALDLAISVVPISSQENAELLALFLPLWTGAAAGVWLLRRGAAPAPPAAEPPPAPPA